MPSPTTDLTPAEAAVKQFCEQMLVEHGLTDALGNPTWTVEFGHSRRTLGSCSYARSKLRFSSDYINEIPFKDSLRVVAHEVAHAIVGPRHSHDHTWTRICLLIGGDGEARYHGTAE